MEKYYKIEPEVSGNIANSDFSDRNASPPKINNLVYEFDGWLGDDIIESIATFLITENLMNAIVQSKMTGITFEKVEVLISEQFGELYDSKSLPKFVWAQIIGDYRKNDFSMSPKHRLIVSERALNVLGKFNIKNCDVEDQ